MSQKSGIRKEPPKKHPFQFLLLLVILGLVLLINAIKPAPVLAEQTGTSYESGVTSYVKSLYATLQTSGFGTDTNTPNWGTYWNRIVTASEWVPSGTATASTVNTGVTFYGNSRTQATGTYPNPGPLSTQAWDNSEAGATQANNGSLTWITNPSPVTGDDNLTGRGGLDPRTGETWSQLLLNSSGTLAFSPTNTSAFDWDGSLTFTVTSANATAGATYTNNGQTFTVVTTIATGTSLTVTATGSPSGTNGTLTKASGTGDATISYTAIPNGTNNVALGSKTAVQLCSSMGNGWRLPTQKELMQAYSDGSYWNLTQPSNYLWSATQSSTTIAWYVILSNGSTAYNNKSTSNESVRCVRP
jgi:hypothetical protein